MNQREIYEHWDHIKGGIRNVWGALSEQDLNRVRGSLSGVTSLVQQQYSEPNQQIKEKLDMIIESYDNPTDLSDYHNLESSYERKPANISDPGEGNTPDDDQQLGSGDETSEQDYDAEEIYDPDQDHEDETYQARVFHHDLFTKDASLNSSDKIVR